LAKEAIEMNLEISGRHALVCAASKGLGKACAMALALEGVNVTINARNKNALEAAAAEIEQAAGIPVNTVACDITSREGQDAVLASLPAVDILVTEDWIAGLDANMLTPIELIRGVIDEMIERNFGRIVNITSSAVKAPIPFLGLSNGARTGLTGFVAGLARQVARHNVTINNLLPGYHATDRLPAAQKYLARQYGGDIEAATRAVLEQIPAGRFGSPAEFGRTCAFLCAASSGYITGQNLLLDGGSYAGTFG
jgi:3-oxoacyl-[acyl-carrier protein] reductase